VRPTALLMASPLLACCSRPADAAAQEKSRTVAHTSRKVEDRENLEREGFMITRFVCHDANTAQHDNMGKNATYSEWEATVKGQAHRFHLTVDKGYVRSKVVKLQLTVASQPTQNIFEGHAKDFDHPVHFVGSIKGLGDAGVYEVQEDNAWQRATIVEQSADASVFFARQEKEIDGRTCLSAPMYEVGPEMVREVNGAALVVPQKVLWFRILGNDPLHGTEISLDRGDGATHMFARRTPNGEETILRFDVDKAYNTCVANMNETLIDVHLKGAAFQMEGGVTTKYKRTWKIRIGLAQHTIDIEKKYNNELYTVTVDQEILVEATARDIDWEGSPFGVSFRFYGSPSAEFMVHKMDKNGVPLNAKAKVLPKAKLFSRECTVQVLDDKSLDSATLMVDGVEFSQLNTWSEPSGSKCKIDAEALEREYRVQVPSLFDDGATQAESLMASFCACYSPPVDKSQEEKVK